eukprot:COSAG02_NODE_1457_length_12507_cov_7.416989_3_plen_74_part_00
MSAQVVVASVLFCLKNVKNACGAGSRAGGLARARVSLAKIAAAAASLARVRARAHWTPNACRPSVIGVDETAL